MGMQLEDDIINICKLILGSILFILILPLILIYQWAYLKWRRQYDK